MSRENEQVVRQPLTVSAQSRRRLEERFYLRFPAATALAARLVWRLLPQSRLRQALLGRAVRLGLEATNRQDFKAAFMLYHPEVEYVSPPQIVVLGLDEVYRGLAARIEVQRKWIAEWGAFQFLPQELIDVGTGHVLILGRMEGRGLSSRAGIDNDWADLFTIVGGRVTREQPFLDRVEALRAVGLSE